MNNAAQVSLTPLALEHHIQTLQGVYAATPGYWAMYHRPGPPPGQAEHDLRTAVETPGRHLLGIVRRLQEDDPSAGAELVGLMDFRLHWPGEGVVYLGLLLVAGPLQRQGIGTSAWGLLKPWLRSEAKMHKARLGVEQFNPGALKFFEHLGFALVGQSDRQRVGDKFVRLLYMEHDLST